MIRAAATAAAVAMTAVLAACSGPAAGPAAGTDVHSTTSPTTAPASSAPPPGLLALPPSQHVTGQPYPAHCTARSVTVTDSAGARSEALPDPGCTPGVVRSDVTESNLAATICTRGYTANPTNPGARPPLKDTAPVKTAAVKAYGQPASARSGDELDHLVPLELAGSSDVRNLWPEPGDWPNHPPFEQNHKDAVENRLHAAVCSHRVPLADAQRAIATDWTTAEHAVGLR